MTNEEINRYIHEQIMGKCWHDVKGGTFRPVTCKNGCGLAVSIALWNASGQRVNPDYCSDASPRSLLMEVVAKVNHYGAIAARTPYILSATAEQIARACVEAHKSEEQNDER